MGLLFFPVRNSQKDQKNSAIFLLLDPSQEKFQISSAHKFLSSSLIFSLISPAINIRRIIILGYKPTMCSLCISLTEPGHLYSYQIDLWDILVELFALLQILMRSLASQCLSSHLQNLTDALRQIYQRLLGHNNQRGYKYQLWFRTAITHTFCSPSESISKLYYQTPV